MPHVSPTSVGLESPVQSVEDFEDVLRTLGCSPARDALERYYYTLAGVIGIWRSGQSKLAVKYVAQKLQRIAGVLKETNVMLEGLDTGVRRSTEIVVAKAIVAALTENPTIGSRDAALDLIQKFRPMAETISAAAMVAPFLMPTEEAKRGPKKKDWHDDFTRLLLTIAKDAGISPTLHEWGSKSPNGWLLEAATKLEEFLPKEMRSPSPAARAQRLVRSRRKSR